MRRLIIVPIAAILVLVCPASARNKALIVSIDGCRPDSLVLADAPNVNALMAAGASSLDARNTLLYGESGPNYSSMLTGTWLKHGVTSNAYRPSEEGNEFPGNQFDQWPHMFSYIENHNPSLYTAQFVGWAPINRGTWADHFADETGALGDSGNANRIAQLLTSGDPDVIFWQISAADSAGHASGFSPSSPDYIRAIGAADSYYGTVLNALRARPGYIDGSEQWLILTVTDHGGYGTSHHLPAPGHELEIQRTFYIASGAGVIPGADLGQPRVYDVALTTMAHVGLDVGALDLDGVVVPALPSTAWRADQDGVLSAARNWTAGAPNGVGFTANFGPAIATPRTITVDAPATFGAVNLGAAENYTLAGENVLTLQAADHAAARITVTQSAASGGHVIATPLLLASPLEVDVAADAAITLAGILDATAIASLSKTGAGTLILSGDQDYAPGAIFDILGGALLLDSDAGSGGADLTLQVTHATVLFGSDQHLDRLIVGDGGRALFAGAHVVVLNHLVFNGVDLGAAVLTPEPCPLSLLPLVTVLLPRRRRPGA